LFWFILRFTCVVLVHFMFHLCCFGLFYVSLVLFWFILRFTCVVLVHFTFHLCCFGSFYVSLVLFWFILCFTCVVLVNFIFFDLFLFFKSKKIQPFYNVLIQQKLTLLFSSWTLLKVVSTFIFLSCDF
jgi:hypothetical protein